MQTVMAISNDICLRYLDNSMLCSLPPPGPPHSVVSVCASRNRRKKMEDRHVVIQDLNTIFNLQEAPPSSYYAIFDGHAGHIAAAYSAAHLHQFLAESKYFATNPQQALVDAFCRTDALFLEKCDVEGLSSGTTAVCVLHRPKENVLYVAWVGDSQALLVNQGRVLQCVRPHKPSREDEKLRIEKEGGYVCFWGTWRVNGQLAVSRAIGDAEYKPYVTAVPEIREIALDGGEDFLIIACDGLWDYLSEDDAARSVYNLVCDNPDNTDHISEHLVQLSKERGSADNISVIVVFFREPSKIAAEAHWANRNDSPITMDTSLDNANNPFSNSNGDNLLTSQKTSSTDNAGLLLNLSDNFKSNNGSDLSPSEDFYRNSERSNGKRSASEFDDEDLGPETDVDAVDDVVSPSIIAAKALADGIVNNNPDGSFNPFVEKCEVEKAALEIDLDLQKQQSSEFDGERSPREETPTPPADAIQDGGIEDNVADSGEESEDEWNYIKGEEANKENISPSQPDLEVADILEEQDNMSQLNPNAAEFVPVSPTRSIPSPVCRSLINDPVIAQSPKRATDIDISVPNLQEFENEVKSRPSDFDAFSNGHDNEGDEKKDLMENLLNGKNIDEIPEFQPGNTPNKVPLTDEFHFGPNAAPFTSSKLLDQSEASTTAVYGGDSTLESSVSSFRNKEDDPMSASFYQDHPGDGTDPFDLNKVQTLPNEDEDEAIPHEDTISDLPEHDPSEGIVNNEITMDNDERIQTTDLDKDEEKEKESPMAPDQDLLGGICELPKSPNPFDQDFAPKADQTESNSQEQSSRIETISPALSDTINQQCELPKATLDECDDMSKPAEQVCNISKSPDLFGVAPKSPEFMKDDDFCQLPKPNEPTADKFELSKSTEALQDDVCQISKSPVPSEDLCHFSKSPAPSEELSQLTKSPEPQILTPEPAGDICTMSAAKTPEPEKREITPSESPLEDITSSVKDISSPLSSPVPDQINFAHEIKNPIEESVPVECLMPTRQEIDDSVIQENSLLNAETESVATNDVNSFLERSQLSDVASPLSPLGEQISFENGSMNSTEIKTDIIAPEFAESAVITPSADTPSAPSTEIEAVQEPEVEKMNVAESVGIAATAAAVAAAGVAVVSTADKKSPKPKPSPAATKKPMSKASPASLTKKPASATASKTAAPKTTASSRTTTTTKTTTSAVAAAKPAVAARTAAPKPRTATTAAAAAKKPLPNGDIKAAPKSTVAARTSTAKPLPARPATAAKASPTKPAAPRPTTAPAKTTTTRSTAAPRPRPTTLTAKTTATTSKTTTTTLSTSKAPATKTTASPTKTTSPPKPRPATIPAKPRVPLSSRVTATKTSTDADKQSKDTANKLKATTTTTTTKTSTSAGRTLTSTVKKTEAKTLAGSTRTTLTKTTTSTKAPIPKRPQELTRNVTKTKTTKVEKPITNGVVTVVTEQITIVNNSVNDNSEELVKDISPIIDNKLILDTNTAD